MTRSLLMIGTALSLASVGCNAGGQDSRVGSGAIKGKVATTYDEAIALGRQQNKPILLVSFQGTGEDVDQMILSEPSITTLSDRFVTARINYNTNRQDVTRLGIARLPAVMVLRPDGSLLWTKPGPTPPEVERAMRQALAAR